MAKMKRRAFLKLAGLAVVSPSLLKSKGLTPGLTNPVDIFQDITDVPGSPKLGGMIDYCEEVIVAGPEEVCCWMFRSSACGYKGSQEKCKYTFDDCKRKGNEVRFGGYPANRRYYAVPINLNTA